MVSVADPSIRALVQHWIAYNWSVTTIELTTTPHCAGVSNGYLVPEQLEVDRWAAILGAYRLTRQAVCVIDSGTALTCDAVDNNGKHLGGVIIPGRDLQKQVLLHGTAGISITDEKISYDRWGRDTNTCITSGIVQSQLGLIEHFLSQLQNFLGTAVSVVVTGGDAEILMAHLPTNSLLVPDLIFQGMTYMMMEQGG
jgi:type III pantothenate kinase